MAKNKSKESVSMMEPMLLPASVADKHGLQDLVVELVQAAARLSASLRPEISASLADILRSTNCYYSNLIEGHNTHPIDIERALNNDFSNQKEERELQLEAKAHIAVQKWIDDGEMTTPHPTKHKILELHRRFCELLPQELLVVTNPDTGEQVDVVPGEIRNRDVIIGRHIPVRANMLETFLDRFENVYGSLSKQQSILAVPAMHHRLLWIHPFVDGNGRVVRLLSHAILREKLDSHSLWSVARGLARRESDYKSHLAACDAQRQGDLDGRGNLSEGALVNFTTFFLEICLDQVAFMRSLIEPDLLRSRIIFWATQQMQAGELPKGSDRILEALLFQGQLPRNEPKAILGSAERTARRVVSELERAGAITSESTRAPLRLAFPTELASHWLPGLFPGKAISRPT